MVKVVLLANDASAGAECGLSLAKCTDASGLLKAMMALTRNSTEVSNVHVSNT